MINNERLKCLGMITTLEETRKTADAAYKLLIEYDFEVEEKQYNYASFSFSTTTTT